jgi:hypothetical protein
MASSPKPLPSSENKTPPPSTQSPSLPQQAKPTQWYISKNEMAAWIIGVTAIAGEHHVHIEMNVAAHSIHTNAPLPCNE